MLADEMTSRAITQMPDNKNAFKVWLEKIVRDHYRDIKRVYNRENVVAKTAAYTATSADDLITCGAGNETFTITLPPVASSAGKVYNIKNVGLGIITIDGNASETIDGAATAVLTTQYESVTLQCSGSEWWIL